MISKNQLILVLLTVLTFSCSVLKTDDNDKKVREMLGQFETDLKLTPLEVFDKYFKTTTHSKENILQALQVLQNQDTLSITCTANFQNPTILRYDVRTQVIIPVTFFIIDSEKTISKESAIIFWIEQRNDALVFSELDADKFYQGYTWIQTEKLYAEERKEELRKREPIYATADSLEQYLDSVIWYAKYNDDLYFYAVNGSWKNAFDDEPLNAVEAYSMGMVSAKGDTIIPFDYDLIGTIGFVRPGMIEIKKDDKYGYYHLDSTRVVVQPVFDMIIPYTAEDSIWALTVIDSTYGWITTEYKYFEGSRSDEADQYISDYKYLRETVVLKAGNQIFCEIPSADHAGFGIIVPPSFYVVNKLFSPLVGGINTTKVPMNGWTDSIEKNSVFNRIGDNIRALITILGERYIGGRESFYGSSQVNFVNENDDVIATTEMPTDKEILFKHVDSFTIELKATATGYHYNAPGNELDIPVYKYFRMNKSNALEELPSNRIFPFTEFVKMDSSYLEGDFSVYVETIYPESQEPTLEEQSVDTEESEDSESENSEFEGDPNYEEEGEEIYKKLSFLTAETITLMRDEILATYGVTPEGSGNEERLQTHHGITFGNVTRADAEKKFTEIDRYNLEFLEKILSLIQRGDFADQQTDSDAI